MISTINREIAIKKELLSKIEWGQDLCQGQSPLPTKKFQRRDLMEQELAYSFHLSSDKNSRVNKHNLRDYDNQRELIITIYGTDDIVNDVKQVYIDEFEEARIDYDNNQTRNDRKVEDYFVKVCKSQNNIACEIIIELGDMDFWNDKDDEYRMKMVDVYAEQMADLKFIVPAFKIANATIHFDETSPHIHIVGVPVIDNCKKCMKKQVGKSQVFTKTSLTEIQDKMRTDCIKS